jgi:adenylate kinase
MRIALTGGPGTGKTRIAHALGKKGFEVIPLNDIVERKKLWSVVDEFGSRVVNLRKLQLETNRLLGKKKNCIVEGHLACEMRLKCDVAVVCRTTPDVLEKRLKKRGYPEKKINENIMCELLDYCTVLSLENYERVYEIRGEGSVGKNVSEIMRIANGKGEKFRAGWVSWSRELRKRII